MNRNQSRPRFIVVGYEITMAILAFISVIFIWSENSFIRNLDLIIWMIFVIDVIVRLAKAENKILYLKKNPLDIIAIIPLDSIFRLARMARLIRLLRTLAVLKHYTQPFYDIIKTNHLDRVLMALFILIFASSIPIHLLEPSINTYTDAVWWAIVTSTTVGYGDISPETIIGRLIAVVLMLFGIGLLGLVTSSVAAYFANNGKESDGRKIEDGNISETVIYMKNQIEKIEELSDEELERLEILIRSYRKSAVNEERVV